MANKVFIGSGAGFSGDRLDAGISVIETLKNRQGPRYLIYEVMGERTLALALAHKRRDPDLGYSPYLDRYLSRVLGMAKQHGVRIVTNMGAANPVGGAKRVHALAREMGIKDLKVAVVLGDDLLEIMSADDIRALPTIEGLDTGSQEIIAANAYIGARPVADALALGADIVLVGRTTDAALVLGPLIHEFGWAQDDWQHLAAGTVAGHLLECGGQVTGGYFCDPGFKDVPGMEVLGFPIAEIDVSGDFVVTKAENTGGLVTRATVIEQLLYEVHDPAAYLTPDVTLDIRDVTLEDDGKDRIRVKGAKGTPPPQTFKATISTDGGWCGEAELTYAGPNALARAKLAADIVRKRCAATGMNEPVRVEILGTGIVFQNDGGNSVELSEPPAWGEYQLRAAIRSGNKEAAQYVADEVLSLFCSGPAGGGGYRCQVADQIATSSILVDRSDIDAQCRAELVMP